MAQSEAERKAKKAEYMKQYFVKRKVEKAEYMKQYAAKNKRLQDDATTKVSILQEAQTIIYGDREKTYGHPSKNLNLIAQYWSLHLGVPVTAVDVCNMMILLKQARLKNQPGHRDSITDIAGYAALIERMQEHEPS